MMLLRQWTLVPFFVSFLVLFSLFCFCFDFSSLLVFDSSRLRLLGSKFESVFYL